jgi:hypothetical protein
MSEIIPQTADSDIFTVNQTECHSPEQLHQKLDAEWRDRVKIAEQKQRQKWADSPGLNVSVRPPSYQPWEAPGISDDVRQRIHVEENVNTYYETHDGFSPAAHLAVHSPDAARFLDDIKCDYLGHSGHLGWFKEISPSSNHTPFDVQFNYDVGQINHFTESGMIVHVRETSDPTATTREQKLFVVVANLMTGELKRLYSDNQQGEYSSPGLANSFNETISLKSRHLSSLGGHHDLDREAALAVKYHAQFDYMLSRRQAKIRYDGTKISFKPEGYSEFETLRPIARLDEQRYLLGRLAFHAGQILNDRGAVEYPSARLSIAN